MMTVVLPKLCRGRAQIRFAANDYPPSDWDEPQPVGTAIVFFEINDVEGLHADIRARGGRPSTLARVNGIKMQVFEQSVWTVTR